MMVTLYVRYLAESAAITSTWTTSRADCEG